VIPAAETVSELTERIKLVLEGEFPDVWVVGEISNMTRARSGHVYLTLKDQGASVSAVIWRSTAERLRHDLTEGMEVLVSGRLNLYPPRGQYQLNVQSIEPRGAGALAAAFEKLKQRLLEEGLFAPERKRSLPFLPRAIGVVTSPTGAAIRDILKVLRRRFPRITVVLAPARVQGEEAAGEIARGIRRLNERGGLDLLIVGRGGGSLEDLWAFNEEAVARAIYASDLPVISAVGHEVDVTIADFVADVRAATPSAAAEIAVPDERELRLTLAGCGARLRAAAKTTVSLRRERVRALAGAYGLKSFLDRLRQRSQNLDEVSRRARTLAEGALRQASDRLRELAGRAEALSPLRVLARGYSMTSRADQDGPLTHAGGVEPGDEIRTRLADGSLRSRVTEVAHGE
jgi:exodeoxyribonuclease VII large subunit